MATINSINNFSASNKFNSNKTAQASFKGEDTKSDSVELSSEKTKKSKTGTLIAAGAGISALAIIFYLVKKHKTPTNIEEDIKKSASKTKNIEEETGDKIEEAGNKGKDKISEESVETTDELNNTTDKETKPTVKERIKATFSKIKNSIVSKFKRNK